MYKTTVKVGGMMCGMCEAHVNDAVRSAVNVKKVDSSRKRGETVIITDGEPDVDAIRTAISKTGYDVGDIDCEPYEKRTLFGRR